MLHVILTYFKDSIFESLKLLPKKRSICIIDSSQRLSVNHTTYSARLREAVAKYVGEERSV